MDESAAVYLNDRVVPLSGATVSVLDHGFLYGDGVYETMRVYGGVVFMLEEHLGRLGNSASLIGLRLPKSPDQVKLAIFETLEACGHKDAYLRVTVSRGEGPIGLDPELCPRPTFFIYAGRFKPQPRDYYEKGLTVAVAGTRRNLKEALDPQIKSLNFLNNIMARMEAKKAGAHEALMLNHMGHLAEGATSNVFFVAGGALCTPGPECGILRGITRDSVLDIARRLDMKVAEGEFTEEDLAGASESFITSSIMEVAPVGRLLRPLLPPGENIKDFHGAGQVTKTLMAEYKKDVFSYVRNTRAAGPSIWGF